MRILICDDDDVIIRWLEAKLVQRGFTVHSVFTCDEALFGYRRRRPFDCVLTDFRMPGIQIKNGIELIHAIRQIDPLQPIILHTVRQGFRYPAR